MSASDVAASASPPHWLMTQGKFAEAAQAFIRIMPEQRETVLQITSNAGSERSAISIASPKPPGIAILFSRAYRARTALVAVPWFLMDIATYGVGLSTPIILGAMSPERQAALPRVTSPTREEALRSICFCCWVLFLESGPFHDSGASGCRRSVSRAWRLGCCCSWSPFAYQIPVCTFLSFLPVSFSSIC
jgi:hypothetical protein